MANQSDQVGALAFIIPLHVILLTGVCQDCQKPTSCPCKVTGAANVCLVRHASERAARLPRPSLHHIYIVAGIRMITNDCFVLYSRQQLMMKLRINAHKEL